MPSLLEAHKFSSRAAQVGFDWPNMEGLFDKLAEETSELREHLQEFPAPGPRPEGRGIAGSGRQKFRKSCERGWKKRLEIFFSCWSTSHDISRLIRNQRCARPIENSAAASNGWKQRLNESGGNLETASMDELESLWQQAKQQEKQS